MAGPAFSPQGELLEFSVIAIRGDDQCDVRMVRRGRTRKIEWSGTLTPEQVAELQREAGVSDCPNCRTSDVR